MTSHHNKVRLVIECSLDERAYIKMLAAQKHMTISEYVINLTKEKLIKKKSKQPNKETLAAIKELEEGKGHSFTDLNDFWEQMGIDPNA